MSVKIPVSEHNIQQSIRLEAGNLNCTMFRANSGKAWTGNQVQRYRDGSILIKDPRPFLGMVSGFSDLVGVSEVLITEDMVGKKVGIAVFAEVKTLKGKARDDQERFLSAMKSRGAKAGIVRSVEEFKSLVK